VNNNGKKDEAESGADRQLKVLEKTFRNRALMFRHFPDAKCAELTWQAVKLVVEPVTFPDGSVHQLERFELIGFARTSADLIEQLT
jgi:hypothetical protein